MCSKNCIILHMCVCAIWIIYNACKCSYRDRQIYNPPRYAVRLLHGCKTFEDVCIKDIVLTQNEEKPLLLYKNAESLTRANRAMWGKM